MNKKEMEKNIKKIITIYNRKQKGLNDLSKWIDWDWEAKDILSYFLKHIGLENTKETRFIAFSRIVDFRETSLKIFLEKNEFSEKESNDILEKSYDFVQDYHLRIHEEIINQVEKENLLTPFYLQIIKGVHLVWSAFGDFYKVWNDHIVNSVNKNLEKDFNWDMEAIMNFLGENNLFELDEKWNPADRSYSVLVWKDKNYKVKTYSEAFKKEVWEIVLRFDKFIKNLSKLEDEVYAQKEAYVNYLTSIKEAFDAKDNLIVKWRKVDENWMKITSPFQIAHPLEYYADKYRKAVSPEWDFRLRNRDVLNTEIFDNILWMFNGFYEDIWRDSYNEIYDFTIKNLNRVQLNISSPIFYYGCFFTGIYSAQVVPNDEIISEKYGKKIFAFPDYVLKSKREEPFMRLQKETMESTLLHKYRKFLFWEDKIFYTVYEIETIWHELGHMLWGDLDTEVEMNKKTGMFKNLEEFKATTSWLIAYFLHWDWSVRKELIMTHIIRCIWLLKYRNITDIIPYYCESLLHLIVLFKSGIVSIKRDKISMYLNDKNYNNLKKEYMEIYTKLIYTYLNKLDAWEFLFEYIYKHEDGYYLPKDTSLANFIRYYYELYKHIWNEVDEITDKWKYTWETESFLERILK